MEKKFKGVLFKWTITDNAIKYGGLIKSTIRLDEIGDLRFIRAQQPKSKDDIQLGHITVYRLTRDENKLSINKTNGNIVEEDKGILLSYHYEQQDDAVEAIYHIIANSRMSEKDKKDRVNKVKETLRGAGIRYSEPSYLDSLYSGSSKSDKPASVVGRAVVGGIVAGPAGAVVGALSAVDKNNRKQK